MSADRKPAPLAFIDTETDGVHPSRKVWEVAIVLREPDGTEASWSTFVEIDLSTADPFGLRVGRFYDRHPLGRSLAGNEPPTSLQGMRYTQASPRAAVAERVARMTHGAHLVGAVPNFDAEVLDRLLREHGLIPSWHDHLVDVENLAVGYLANVGPPRDWAPPWSSDDLTAALGIEPTPDDERHTAMGDARWAQRVYDRVLGVEDRRDLSAIHLDAARAAARADW